MYRHSPWPNVNEFIKSFPAGSLLIDIGCGNGKYLNCSKSLFSIGSDRSNNLLKGVLFKSNLCNCCHFKTVYVTNISHCLKSLSVQMATDINNHLTYNFERMFKRFLYTQNLSANEINQVYNNKEYKGDNMFIKKYNNVYRQSLKFKTDSTSLLVRLKLLYMIQQYFNKIYQLLAYKTFKKRQT